MNTSAIFNDKGHEFSSSGTSEAGLPDKHNQPLTFPKKSVLVGTLIFSFFLSFYLLNGLHLITAHRMRSRGHHDNDMFFQADSRYATSALIESDIKHKRILLHPLFVIYFNPLGHVLNRFIGNTDISATVYCAIAGAFCVLAAWYFFMIIGVDIVKSTLYAAIFGFSSSTFIFSILPDTYIFSAIGIVLLLIIAEKRSRKMQWIAVSVYLMGITISNIAFAVAAAFFYLFKGNLRIFSYKEKIIQYAGGISVSFILFSILQKAIYRKWVFQYIGRANREKQFLYIPESLTEGLARAKQLMLHMLFFNITAPPASLVQHPMFQDIQMVSFQKSSLLSYELTGIIACLIWVILAAVAIWSLMKYKLYRQNLVRVLLLCLAINGILHFFYGEDLMLYSCHWTFFLLVLVFYSLEKANARKLFFHQYHLLLILLALFLFVNNSLIVEEIIHAF